MRRGLRAMVAVGAGVLLLVAVMVLRPLPGVEVIPVAPDGLRVVVPAPLPVDDFPEELPPGAMLDGRRKPIPGEAAPEPVPPQVFEAWKTDWLDRIEHTAALCGAVVQVACTDQACVVRSPGHRLGHYARRPMRAVEELMHYGLGLPREIDQCGTIADRLSRETELISAWTGCFAFHPRQPGERNPIGDAHASALCEHLLAEGAAAP